MLRIRFRIQLVIPQARRLGLLTPTIARTFDAGVAMLGLLACDVAGRFCLSMTAPRMIVTRPSLSIFYAEPVLYGVWARSAPRPEDVSACMSSAFQQAKAAKRCALIVAIHPDMPLPDASVRDVVTAEMKRLDPYIVCGATVLGREGFLGTAMRAMTSTLQLLSRPSHPEKIVGSGREAAAFVHGILAKQGGSAPSFDTIVAGYEHVTTQVWKTA